MEGYTLITKPNPSHVATFFLTTLLLITFRTPPISAAAAAAAVTTTPSKASIKFIKISCNKTTYSPLCFKTLSPYTSFIKTNPLMLCNTALATTIKAANATATMVAKYVKQNGISVKESGPIKDCLVEIKDTIFRLKECLKAMSKLKGPDKEFQMNNAKTWASAAISDESTCWDSVSGKKVNPDLKKKIRDSIQKVVQLNSNALFLINHLKY